jgi:AraC-like DNA-binding protein
MRLGDVHASALAEPPLWPPLLATRGPGGKSAPHAHHAMHVVLALAGELRLRQGRSWQRVAGVVTAPDVPHALDGSEADVLLVFLDPESDAGVALQSVLGGATRALTDDERDRLVAGGVDPMAIMREGGVAWTGHAVDVLAGSTSPSQPRRIHPRVRRLLRQLRALPVGADASLETLAQSVGLSPGRLMHAFTESIGVPLRPYLAWLKLQRAAAAVVAGAPLSDAAAASGFADAAHMSRTFRRMLGMPPSALRVAAS